MSDTRQEAAQELLEAGMASGMEDSLGASLSGSFAPPQSATPHQPATEVGTTQAAGTVAAEPEAESTPVPGMDDWKPTYDAYVEEWQKEADIAREKALKNRKFYEDEAEKEEKKKKDEEALKKRREREEKRAEEGRERLRRELAGEIKPSGKGKMGGKGDDDKVKEAWEMVKASEGAETGDGKDGKVAAGDARGVMPQDVKAGMAQVDGKARPQIKQTMYDPTSSTEPLPPSMQQSETSTSGPTSHPTESQAASRHSATSQAWSEISATPSSGEDISPGSTRSGFSSSQNDEAHQSSKTINDQNPYSSSRLPTVNSSSNPEKMSLTSTPSPKNNSNNHSSPPSQPPSLTLSLFTSPQNLSITRVLAVLGINLFLPFVNGVMLGFGEIFARETIRVGRLVFRGERRLFGFGGGRNVWGGAEEGEARGGGRGVAGVGLSGSGGFP